MTQPSLRLAKFMVSLIVSLTVEGSTKPLGIFWGLFFCYRMIKITV